MQWEETGKVRGSICSQRTFPHFPHRFLNEITYRLISGKDEFKANNIKWIEKLVLQMMKEKTAFKCIKIISMHT